MPQPDYPKSRSGDFKDNAIWYALEAGEGYQQRQHDVLFFGKTVKGVCPKGTVFNGGALFAYFRYSGYTYITGELYRKLLARDDKHGPFIPEHVKERLHERFRPQPGHV